MGIDLSSAGNVIATGNITSGNLLIDGLISATGSITATGNISGAYILGNGSQLTGVVATSVGTYLV